MINNINKISYKVNKGVLGFIKNCGLILDRISNISKKHEYDNIKKTKNKEKEYRAYISKIILEHIIMSIAYIYENIPNIYFFIRSDQHDKNYYKLNYFN